MQYASRKKKKRFIEEQQKLADKIKLDCSQAVNWYKRTAENGNIEAMYKLGYCYELGVGANKDTSIAKKWLKKAADNKHSGAKKTLEKLSNQ